MTPEEEEAKWAAIAARAERRAAEKARVVVARPPSAAGIVFVSKAERGAVEAAKKKKKRKKRPKVSAPVVLPPALPPALPIRKTKKRHNLKPEFEWKKEEDTYNGAFEDGQGEDVVVKRESALERTKRKLKSTTNASMKLKYKSRLAKLERRAAGRAHWRDLESVSEMTSRDWKELREDCEIFVSGSDVPLPIRKWSEVEVHPDVMRGVDYSSPNPVQMQGIPIGLSRRDLVGIARTGSGKTCAFALPMLEFVTTRSSEEREACSELGPFACCLAPTRELALQIQSEIDRLGRFVNIRTVCCIGGASMEQQYDSVRDGVDIVVATPGRLINMLEERKIVLGRCQLVVLDEADQMVDMGFESQLRQVLKETSNCDSTRLMFSATFTDELRQIASTYLKNPITLRVGDKRENTHADITQHVDLLKDNSDSAKQVALKRLLRQQVRPPIILFCNSKTRCDQVANFIATSCGMRAKALHSALQQHQRISALDGFKSGRVDVLVATDVAGRGLDIDDVKHVVNYDAPTTVDRYTHRIGRTGRAGKKGDAWTFLTEDDRDLFKPLVRFLKRANAEIPKDLEVTIE